MNGAEGNLFRCKHPLCFCSLSVSDSNGVSLPCQGSHEQLVVARSSNIMIIKKLSAGLSYVWFSCWNLINNLRWGPFIFLVLSTVLYFLHSNAGDLSNLYCEAQMLLHGQAVGYRPKGCKKYIEDGLRVGTLGCKINLYGLGDEALPTDPTRVHTRWWFLFNVVTNVP